MGQLMISKWECIRFSPVQHNYPMANISQHILRVQRLLKTVYLGSEIYADLLSLQINDWQTATVWEEGTTYNEDDIVVYYDTFLRAKKTTTTQPCADLNDENWEEAIKYDDAVLEELWTDYLRYWLSYSVISESIGYTSRPMGPAGIVSRQNDRQGTKEVDSVGVDRAGKGLLIDAGVYMDQMIDFINDNQDHEVLNKATLINPNIPGKEQTQATSIFFKYHNK